MSYATKIAVQGCTVTVSPPTEADYEFNCMSAAQARYLASMLKTVQEAGYIEGRNDAPQWKWGWLVRKESFWFGVHYSPHNKRWCINLIPCVTFWITKPGGTTP